MGRKYISKWVAKKQEDIKSSELGSKILKEEEIVLVKYKSKKWNLKELLQHLTSEVEKLSQNQCVPKVSCIFKGREYMADKYISNSKRTRECCRSIGVPYWDDEEYIK